MCQFYLHQCFYREIITRKVANQGDIIVTIIATIFYYYYYYYYYYCYCYYCYYFYNYYYFNNNNFILGWQKCSQ